jgi:hypothetical protein
MACLGRGQVHLGSVDLHEGWLILNAAHFVMLDSFNVALTTSNELVNNKKKTYSNQKFYQKQIFNFLSLAA